MIAALKAASDAVKLAVGFAAGAILAGVIAYAAGHWLGVSEGRAIERTAALTKSVDVLRNRSATDAQIRSMPPDALCRSLGGVWMSDEQKCG